MVLFLRVPRDFTERLCTKIHIQFTYCMSFTKQSSRLGVNGTVAIMIDMIQVTKMANITERMLGRANGLSEKRRESEVIMNLTVVVQECRNRMTMSRSRDTSQADLERLQMRASHVHKSINFQKDKSKSQSFYEMTQLQSYLSCNGQVVVNSPYENVRFPTNRYFPTSLEISM